MNKLISFLKKLCQCKCACQTICDFEIKSPSEQNGSEIQETESLGQNTPRLSPRISPRVSPRIIRQLPQIPHNENSIEGNNVYVTVS